MIRAGLPSDMPAITHVRTSVRENHLSVEQMAARGIIADMEAGHLGTWVAEAEGRIATFSMADRRDGSIFALFVLPEHEGRGFGTALLAACENWFRQQGLREANLSTGRDTKAHAFYLHRGWLESDGGAKADPQDIYFRKRL